MCSSALGIVIVLLKERRPYCRLFLRHFGKRDNKVPPPYPTTPHVLQYRTPTFGEGAKESWPLAPTYLIAQPHEACIANACATRFPLDLLRLLGSELDLAARAHPAARHRTHEICTTQMAAGRLMFLCVERWQAGK